MNFTCYDADDTCKCAIEKAYRAGLTDFYNRWDICKAAELLGKKEKLPVYKFLKEPLIRKFGDKWYASLEACAEEWEKQKGE